MRMLVSAVVVIMSTTQRTGSRITRSKRSSTMPWATSTPRTPRPAGPPARPGRPGPGGGRPGIRSATGGAARFSRRLGPRRMASYEGASGVVEIRTGDPYASEFGDASESGLITMDVGAVGTRGAGKTTLPFVAIHEIGHVYGYWSLGRPSGASGAEALMFENAARRGRIRAERTEHCCYPPLARVVP